jgi:hypothetical protein
MTAVDDDVPGSGHNTGNPYKAAEDCMQPGRQTG